jgi:hypothetical protein
MKKLTVTMRGQITLTKDVLQHLDVPRGGKIRLDLLPDGRAELRADGPAGSWRDLSGMLKGKGNGARLSIEELSVKTEPLGARIEPRRINFKR